MGTRGGARKGAGRPVGSRSESTILRDQALNDFKDRVAKLSQSILDSQLSLARGLQFLYKVAKDEEGQKSKPVLVTSEDEIHDYLDGVYDDQPDVYYYLTVKEPNNQAIDSMFNRTFGKAAETVNANVTGTFSLAELFSATKNGQD